MWEIIYLIAVAQDSECNYGHIFYFFAKKVSKLRSAILEDIAKILEGLRKLLGNQIALKKYHAKGCVIKTMNLTLDFPSNPIKINVRGHTQTT